MDVSVFNETAVKYRKELLLLPLFSMADSLKYMTLRPGIQYKEAVGTLLGEYELKPYTGNIDAQGSISVKKRELEVFRGDVITYENLEDLRKTIVGNKLGDLILLGKMKEPNKHPLEKQIIGLVTAQVGDKLNASLFDGVRNAGGSLTADLFNGFDTITSNEIADNKISTTLKNYEPNLGVIDRTNALEKLKDFYRAADPLLRKQNTFMYVDPIILDAYEDSYQDERGTAPFNNKFEQTFLEGSRKKCEIVPLVGKTGSGYIHITTKKNMLIGVDQMSDKDFVKVRDVENPYQTQFVLNMMFGAEFEQINSQNFYVGKVTL